MTKSDTLDVKQGARTRGKIRRNAQETRERLLQAATQEFSERGYVRSHGRASRVHQLDTQREHAGRAHVA